MKMQTKGLYFIKVQKSPDEDLHEQNRWTNAEKKSQMKIRVELQTTKHLVFIMVLKEKNDLHMNKDGGENMVV